MPSVLIVLCFERSNEIGHFDRRDIPPSLSFGKPLNTQDRVRMIRRHKSSDLSPIEHVANDLKKGIRGVRVLRADLGMNGLNVSRDDARGESSAEHWKDSAS